MIGGSLDDYPDIERPELLDRLFDLQLEICKLDNDTAKKVTRLAAFVLIESYATSVIETKLWSVLRMLRDQDTSEKLIRVLAGRLYRENERSKTAENMFNSADLEGVSFNIPHAKLRNSLAHNIDSLELSNNQIKYRTRTTKGGYQEQTLTIDEIFNDLGTQVHILFDLSHSRA